MPFALGGVKRIFLVNTCSTTLPGHLRVSWICLLICLCKHLLIPLDMPSLFYLDALECFHLWCGYTAHGAKTVYGVNNLVRALHLLVYYLWMSLERTTVCNLKAHYLKEFQSSFEVWGYHPSRRRPSLSPFRWSRRYAEVTSKPTSGKHQWYVGWAGQFTYCRLRV